MKLNHLKKIRVIISVFFFFFISILFLDLSGNLARLISPSALYLQFIPSLFNYINLPSFAAAGFIFILLVTLLFGRIYCSSVCPLGFFQDLFIFIKKIRKKKNRFRFKFEQPLDRTRLLILIISLLFFLFGINIFLYILDPFSNYGRMLSELFRPLIVAGNNLLSSIFALFQNYSIAPHKFSGSNYFTLSFSLLFLIIIVWFSLAKGRLFCNSVCPVGTLLGVFSKFSLFQISVDEINCTKCGVCEHVCKSNCIDSESEFIDFTRCVGCFNCFDICPSSGLKYQFQFGNSFADQKKKLSVERRKFLSGIIVYGIGLTEFTYAQNKIEVSKNNKIPIFDCGPISPPGSNGLDHLNDKCTACQLCISACPSNVLQPSFLEYGFLNIMQPMMNYHSSFCDYECVLCSEVCPSGAIRKITPDEKKLIQIGRANFVKENCIVEIQGTDCAACSEHCPTKAVTLKPYKNNLRLPEVEKEICVGCGACEFACPAVPNKAIYVESNPIHGRAKLPPKEEINQEIDYSEDFPF